jgi:hypothetical protein
MTARQIITEEVNAANEVWKYQLWGGVKRFLLDDYLSKELTRKVGARESARVMRRLHLSLRSGVIHFRLDPRAR